MTRAELNMYDLVLAWWVIFIFMRVEKMKSRHRVGMHCTRVTSYIPTTYLNFNSENVPQKCFWIDNFKKHWKRYIKMLCLEWEVAVLLSASHLSWFAGPSTQSSLPCLLWGIRRLRQQSCMFPFSLSPAHRIRPLHLKFLPGASAPCCWGCQD